MDEKLLMQVEKSVSLTGLGVLLLPQLATPLLLQFDLHTQWAVLLIGPDGYEENAIASIEEVTRPAELPDATAPATRALLLTQEPASLVPVGTKVYWLRPAN